MVLSLLSSLCRFSSPPTYVALFASSSPFSRCDSMLKELLDEYSWPGLHCPIILWHPEPSGVSMLKRHSFMKLQSKTTQLLHPNLANTIHVEPTYSSGTVSTKRCHSQPSKRHWECLSRALLFVDCLCLGPPQMYSGWERCYVDALITPLWLHVRGTRA